MRHLLHTSITILLVDLLYVSFFYNEVTNCTMETEVHTPLEISAAQWERYNIVSKQVSNLRVKQKRQIFVSMRETTDVDMHSFLPHYGITCGEFSIFHILGQ